MRTRIVAIVVAAAFVAGAALAFAGLQSAHGPYPGATGAPAIAGMPAEFDCALCHEGNPVNAPSGRVEVLGIPPVYNPGQVYPLTVRLTSTASAGTPGRKWGFELGAVRRSDGAAGGTFLLPDFDTLQVVTGENPFSSRSYVEHTFVGTRTGLAGPVQWTLAWAAPASPEGTIAFFCAGNAADGTFGTGGDHVYTSRDSSRALGTGSAPLDAIAGLALSPVLPNPSRGPVTLAYAVPQAGRVELSIHDVRGRLVCTLLAERREAGAAVARWDGRDAGGRPAAAGVYFARLRSADQRSSPATRHFTLTR